MLIAAGNLRWQLLAVPVDNRRSIPKDKPGQAVGTLHQPRRCRRRPSASFSGIDGKLLHSTLVVVTFTLPLTFRSPVLCLLPSSRPTGAEGGPGRYRGPGDPGQSHQQRPERRHLDDAVFGPGSYCATLRS